MTPATDLTLYEIENELLFALDTIDGMELDDPLRGELEAQIAGTVALELRKIDGVCRMLAHFDGQTALATAEIKRIQARKARCERATERLEAAAKGAMELAGKTKVEGETSTLKLQANPPSVVIVDADLVPAAYKTCVPESWTIRKADVAKALKAGVLVPGADLSEGNTRLVRS